MRSVCAAILIVVGSGLLLASSPQAWASSTVQGTLEGVSCTSSSFCMAVGYKSHYPAPQRAMTYVWNGSTWHEVPTPAPPSGFSADTMDRVACASNSSCYAIGSRWATNNSHEIDVEHWNGSAWSDFTIDRPGGGVLNAVSCSGSTCVVVGMHYAPGATSPAALGWVLRADAFRLTPLAATPYPVSQLDGVSCMPGGTCNAAGSITRSSVPLIEHWDGTRWTSFGVGSTVPASATPAGLSGISCPVVGSCVAVGYSRNASAPLVENRFNGAPWTAAYPPVPQPWLGGLGTVSCLSYQTCAGLAFVSSGGFSAALFAWRDATTGHFIYSQCTPSIACDAANVTAVSCASGQCTYVGVNNHGLPIAYRGTGLKPTPQNVPAPS